MKFSNIHPASEFGFLLGIFSEGGGGGKIYCYANFFLYANFSIVLNQIWGGGKLLQGKARSQPNNVSKHRKELFYRHVALSSNKVHDPLPNFYPGPWFQNNFVHVL